MYIYIYIRICLSLSIHIYIYIYVYIHTHIHLDLCIYVLISGRHVRRYRQAAGRRRQLQQDRREALRVPEGGLEARGRAGADESAVQGEPLLHLLQRVPDADGAAHHEPRVSEVGATQLDPTPSNLIFINMIWNY